MSTAETKLITCKFSLHIIALDDFSRCQLLKPNQSLASFHCIYINIIALDDFSCQIIKSFNFNVDYIQKGLPVEWCGPVDTISALHLHTLTRK